MIVDVVVVVPNIGTNLQRSSWSAFGRSTDNGVSGPYKRNYFPLFPLIKKVLCWVQKNFGLKNDDPKNWFKKNY